MGVKEPVLNDDPAGYCREVESYLCRRNGGHLIRIVGPAFVLVSGWAAAGVPLSLVCRGIDRVAERRERTRSASRPIRIEFCEADVREVFDEWRRAVGIGAHQPGVLAAVSESSGEATKRRPSLAQHLQRVIARLATISTSSPRPAALEAAMADIASELGVALGSAPRIRGTERSRLVARLAALEAVLAAAAEQATPVAVQQQLERDVERDLSAFQGRMPPAAFDEAMAAARRKAVWEHWRLPTLRFD